MENQTLTREQRIAIAQHHEDIRIMMQKLPPEDRYLICDQGWYNNTIKGYFIAALRIAGKSDDEIRELLSNVKHALDEKSSYEADQLYMQF